MVDSTGNDAVLRLWAFPEAPREIQQALNLAGAELASWVAHIPKQLLDEPIAAILSMSSTLSQPVKTIFLNDGSKLLCALCPATHGSYQQQPALLPAKT